MLQDKVTVSSKGYASTLFTFSKKRKIVWGEICNYLNQHFIPKDSAVLELGSGYGDFIGQIKARKKVAIEIEDIHEERMQSYPDVKILFGSAMELLPILDKDQFDFVFASNYFEHFVIEDIKEQIRGVTGVLKEGGKLVIIQPNFQLYPGKYFDDWTHKTVFSHETMVGFLEMNGFRSQHCQKGFLPHSMKSRLPVSKILVRLYLNSPIKPLASQFLLIAEKLAI
jgi:ubiquinone/menaquinone biosynthesis C-methylase UbiE